MLYILYIGFKRKVFLNFCKKDVHETENLLETYSEN